VLRALKLSDDDSGLVEERIEFHGLAGHEVGYVYDVALGLDDQSPDAQRAATH
jgi:hypothetical protein